MNEKRFSVNVVQHGPRMMSVSVYDNKRIGNHAYGHVLRLGQLGDGASCMNTPRQALTLARRVVKLLNEEERQHDEERSKARQSKLNARADRGSKHVGA